MRRTIHLTLLIAFLFSLIIVFPAAAAPARADRGAWAPNVAYAVNDTVTYAGSSYKCLQAHTSIVTWEPTNTPALWQLLGSAGPTATRTKTAIPGPTATRTRTPTAGPSLTPSRTPTQTSGGGNFPARFAAPYVESWNNTSVNNLANATGNKFYTLAFIIGDGTCRGAFNGDMPLSGNPFVTDVANLRAQGGDVIISFGGASGTELGQACTSVSSLQAAYQAVVTKYNLKWMDLDIEGAPIADTASIDRRNKALAGLQAANPGLRVSYTLAVDRSGLPQTQINLLTNAKSNGVNVSVVNIMAMDYGPCYSDMGQAAIDAAVATHNQLTANSITAKVGVTPMIGVNDVSCENFTTSNASQLVTYAQANSYISLLAFWAVGADPNHSYLNIFKTFH
jgi:hypothetical protein